MKLILILLLTSLTFAGPTKVGNGDDGSDLEGFDLVRSGRLVETRIKAVELLKKLNIQGVPHLGALIPEVESTKIYLTKRNISTNRLKELGAFHSGEQKFVYARTFARPYAATRFFPAALGLDDSQLIALHIHEGLHRALPASFREDEKVCTNITLAIVTPMSSHDQVKDVVENNIDKYTGQFKGRVRNHSAKVSVSHSQFGEHDKDAKVFVPLQAVTKFENRIYPFKGKLSLLGLGIDVTRVKTKDESYIATLGLFTSFDLYTINGFDINLYGLWNRDSGNGKTVTTSYMGRDSFRGGISFDKKSGEIVGKNSLEFMIQKEFDKTYDEGSVRHNFGSITKIASELVYQHGNWSFGGFGRLQLFGASDHTVSTVKYSQGRSTIFSGGPVVKYIKKRLEIEAKLNLALDTNEDSGTFNLHDLESEGSSQNSLSFKLSYFFY